MSVSPKLSKTDRTRKVARVTTGDGLFTSTISPSNYNIGEPQIEGVNDVSMALAFGWGPETDKGGKDLLPMPGKLAKTVRFGSTFLGCLSRPTASPHR